MRGMRVIPPVSRILGLRLPHLGGTLAWEWPRNLHPDEPSLLYLLRVY